MYGITIYKNIFNFELFAIDQWSSNKNSFGYKPFNLSSGLKLKKLLHNSKNNIRKIFIQLLKKEKSFTPITSVDIVFILEYSNHCSIYNKIAPFLDKKGISHVPVFINKIGKYEDSFSNFSFRAFNLQYLISKMLADIWVIITSKNYNAVLEKLLINSKMFLTSYLYYNSTRLLKKFYKPRLVVFFRFDGIKDRSLAMGLKERDIYSVCIQHGSVVIHPRFSNPIVNEFISWSDVYSEFIIQSGAQCKITSIGSVESDELFQRAKKGSQYTNQGKLKLLVMPPSGKSSSLNSDKDLMIHLISQLDKKQFEVTLKPHPDDDNLKNKEVAKLSELRYIRPTSEVDFENYDIIILNNSTAGLEAAIFKKPLILIAAHEDNIVVNHYLSEGIALLARNFAELEIALGNIKTNYNTYQERCMLFINKYLDNHGLAAQEMADYLSTKVCVA